MSLFSLYNKTKKNINKSSFKGKNAISFKAYEILKKFVVDGVVTPEKLDSAYPKNTKLKVIKNVSQRSLKTFYKLSDKYLTDKFGIISQVNNTKQIPFKKNLSPKAKDLLSKIKNNSSRYEKIDLLIKNLKKK